MGNLIKMTVETHLTKRAALHKGEVGLFPTYEGAADDIRPIANGTDCLCKVSSPKNLALLAKLWCLADIVAQSVDGIYDKTDGMEYLKVKARFVKTKIHPISGEIEVTGRSLSRCSNETLSRLANRMVHIISSDLIPGLPEGELRKKLEEMTK